MKRFLRKGAICSVHRSDGDRKTYIDLVIGRWFAVNAPDGINSITIGFRIIHLAALFPPEADLQPPEADLRLIFSTRYETYDLLEDLPLALGS